MLRPASGEVLWEAGNAYDLTLVVACGVRLVDRRDERVSFVIEAGDFVGETGDFVGETGDFVGETGDFVGGPCATPTPGIARPRR